MQYIEPAGRLLCGVFLYFDFGKENLVTLLRLKRQRIDTACALKRIGIRQADDGAQCRDQLLKQHTTQARGPDEVTRDKVWEFMSDPIERS